MRSTKHEDKTCPRCGQRFECKLNNPVHCGCADIEIGREALEEIALSYDDCLCAACLREVAEGGPGALAPGNRSVTNPG
jgi:hypothetical protein